MNKQLKQKDIKPVREHLAAKQKNKCRLCKNTIESQVLDHDHRTHRIRATLCNACNGSMCLGGIEKRLEWLTKRSGMSYEAATKHLVKYILSDYGSNAFHPNRIKDEMKRFKRLTKKGMINRLGNRIELEKLTKKELEKEFRKLLDKI